MEFILDGQRLSLRMAWWEDDELIAKQKEQERTIVKKRIFLENFERASGRIVAAVQHTDISRSTFYHWMKTDPEFAENVKAILSQQGTIVRDVLTTKALEGDIRALMYLDKRLNKEVNNDIKTEVHIYHHSDRNVEEVPLRTLEDLIDEEARRRKEAFENGLLPHMKTEGGADRKRPWETDEPVA